MSVEFNIENINDNLAVRCCSFCRRAGHNITTCDSELIRNFASETLNFIQLSSQEQTQIVTFRNYLLNKALYAPNVVKAFAIRHCGANTRSNMSICIELIIQYFIPQIQNMETNNQTIQESPVTEESESAEQAHHYNLRRGRRFGFSELGLDNIQMSSPSIHETETESILYAMMFIQIIRSISESTQFNKKFHIKTKISEKQDDLHEKCECSICYDEHEKQNFIKLNCGHEFCKDCIKQSLQNEIKKTPCCAFCRADIKIFEIKHELIKNSFDKLITSEDNP